MLNDSPRDAPGIALAVYMCVCVCVFSVKLLSPFISKSCTTRAGSQMCSRDCSGVLVVASLEETLWGTLVGSRGMAVASLKETRGLLSRFDCVYSDYITQGCPGLWRLL